MPYRKFNPCRPCCACWPPKVDRQIIRTGDYSTPTIYAVFNGLPFTMAFTPDTNVYESGGGPHWRGTVELPAGYAFTFDDFDDLLYAGDIENGNYLNYNLFAVPTNTSPITLDIIYAHGIGVYVQLDNGWEKVDDVLTPDSSDHENGLYGAAIPVYEEYCNVAQHTYGPESFLRTLGQIGRISSTRIAAPGPPPSRVTDKSNTIGGYVVPHGSHLVVSSEPFETAGTMYYRSGKCMRRKVAVKLTEDGAYGTDYLDGYETEGYGFYPVKRSLVTNLPGDTAGVVDAHDGIPETYDGPSIGGGPNPVDGVTVGYAFNIQTDDAVGYGYVSLADVPVGSYSDPGAVPYNYRYLGHSNIKVWQKDRMLMYLWCTYPFGGDYPAGQAIDWQTFPIGFVAYEDGLYSEVIYSRSAGANLYAGRTNYFNITSPAASGVVYQFGSPAPYEEYGDYLVGGLAVDQNNASPFYGQYTSSSDPSSLPRSPVILNASGLGTDSKIHVEVSRLP